MLRSNPIVRVAIDRDATLRSRDKHGHKDAVIGTFLDPVTLYRVLDGEELARINHQGEITGGLFAVFGERAHGASWAALPLEELVRWGRGWQRARLGRDLFIAKIDGLGKRFYHMGPTIGFDPAGPPEQIVTMDVEECNTGLGCSLRVPFNEAEFLHVRPSGDVERISLAAIDAYAERVLRPVMLRSFGSPHAFGGTILGFRVIVSQDQTFTRKLWQVEIVTGTELAHEERPFVMGARSKKQAIDTAVEILSHGPPVGIVFLNRRPPGFERVAPRQIWRFKRTRWHADRLEVEEVGANYVVGKWLDRPTWGSERAVIEARRFMREFVWMALGHRTSIA